MNKTDTAKILSHFQAAYPHLYVVFIIFALFSLNSCTVFNGTRLENVLGADYNIVKIAYQMASDLEKQAFPPLIPYDPEQPILTTTFVNNDDLSETSHFSRVLQEHLASGFVKMGYAVNEIKLRNEMQIKPGSGETILSRNLFDIQPKQTAQAISVGTYSITQRTMYLSARIINPVNSNIISSVDYKLVMDKNMLAMFGLQLEPEDNINLVDEPKTSFITKLLY